MYTIILMYQFNFAIRNSCYGYDEEEEEYGEDSEAFGGASLVKS